MNKKPIKVHRNLLLNLIGYQVFRYCLWKIILTIRRKLYKNHQIDNSLRNNGVIFLPLAKEVSITKLENEFKILKSILDLKDYDNKDNFKRTIIKDSDTIVDRLILPLKELKSKKDYNEIYKLIINSPAWEYVSYDLGIKKLPDEDLILWFDKIVYGTNSDVGTWHTDTFYDSHKYWFFPFGIEENNGIPMNYLKGTNKFNLNRIFLEYWSSITMNKNTDPSWRIKKDSSFVKNYSSISNISSKNSTFIANVHGFHARAKVKSGAYRYQLHFSIR
tara:strand:+ start:1 stop:825 length:825 start_codon:yes stop_codon:yes gene_type:complete